MILCFMQFEPSRHGHGGSQRAWYLLNALATLGPVHLILLSSKAARSADDDAELTLAGVKTVVRVAIPEWTPSWHKWRLVPRRMGRWIDVARMRSVYAPRFSAQVVSRIAQSLPVKRADIVFAGRLSAACIADALIRRQLLTTRVKVVDFDDIQSRFEQREGQAERSLLATDRILMSRLQVLLIRKMEARIASAWDAVSVCSDDDAAFMASELPSARLFRVPNVIDKSLLTHLPAARFTILFVGNLAFGPNQQGLELFVRECWPRLQNAGARAVAMKVVGLNPSNSLRTLLQSAGIELFENVPSVEPYYAQADAVIVPILFGSGTRVKILEAMAYGLPVVSTSVGAEGLELQPGRHALIADDMGDFAAAILALARDPDLWSRLAAEGRALQQERFSPPAMLRAMRAMVTPRAALTGDSTQGEGREPAVPLP